MRNLLLLCPYCGRKIRYENSERHVNERCRLRPDRPKPKLLAVDYGEDKRSKFDEKVIKKAGLSEIQTSIAWALKLQHQLSDDEAIWLTQTPLDRNAALKRIVLRREKRHRKELRIQESIALAKSGGSYYRSPIARAKASGEKHWWPFKK